MQEQVTLISKTSSGNSFNRIEKETSNTIFCTEHNVGRREFYDAESNGIKAEYKLNVWSHEYNGETIAEYGTDKNGEAKRYKIYRTHKVGDEIELYLADEG